MKFFTRMLFIIAISIVLAPAAFGFVEKRALIGMVQFPKNVNSVPPIRFYFAGKKVRSETDNENHSLVFFILENKYQSYFYFVVTEHLEFERQENTIKYLKIDPSKPYKFYVFEQISHKDKPPTWRIKEISLPEASGRIPDETIIMHYDPSYIDHISGGGAIEFPKIYIKENLSEHKLHADSIKLLLGSLDFDGIHQSVSNTIRQGSSSKIIIAFDQ